MPAMLADSVGNRSTLPTEALDRSQTHQTRRAAISGLARDQDADTMVARALVSIATDERDNRWRANRRAPRSFACPGAPAFSHSRDWPQCTGRLGSPHRPTRHLKVWRSAGLRLPARRRVQRDVARRTARRGQAQSRPGVCHRCRRQAHSRRLVQIHGEPHAARGHYGSCAIWRRPAYERAPCTVPRHGTSSNVRRRAVDTPRRSSNPRVKLALEALVQRRESIGMLR